MKNQSRFLSGGFFFMAAVGFHVPVFAQSANQHSNAVVCASRVQMGDAIGEVQDQRIAVFETGNQTGVGAEVYIASDRALYLAKTELKI